MSKLDLSSLTLGPLASSVRAQVSPHQWGQIVNAAHSRGFSVNSFLDSSIPNALKERTPQYLKQQATQMVASAYAPAKRDLSQREQQVQALDAKRSQDLQYYNNWLNSQHQALSTAAQASDHALESTAQAVQASTGAAYDQARAGAIHQLSQLPGTVSDFSGANALDQVDAHKAAGVGEVGATAGQALAGVGTAQGMNELANANNFATIAALNAKRTADTWSATNALNSEGMKLDSQQSGDLSKAIQDALAQEVTKAQSNRDYAAVAQKLDLQKQNQNSLISSRNSATKNNAARLAETIRHNQQMESAKTDAKNSSDKNAAANFEAKWGVSRDTFLGWNDQQRQQYLQRARDRGIITGGKSKGGNSFTDTQVRASAKDYRTALGWAQQHKPTYGELNQLVTALQAPKAQGQAVHDPTTGKAIYNADGTPKRTGGGGLGISDPLLARVVAEVAIYGGVDAKTQKRFLSQYGITVPLDKKRVTFKPNRPTG